MILEGNKIYLRPMTVQDTDDVVRWRNEEFVRNNFIYRGEFTREIHLNWIKTKVETGEVIQFIIVEKGTNRSVGSVYLRDIDRDELTGEYGIFIGESDALGKGYGNEVAVLMVNYSKNELGLSKLFLRLYSENIPALKSYQHAGFEIVDGKTEIKNDKEVIFMEKKL